MPRGAARFLLFGSMVVGLLLALELLCRAVPDGFAAVSHRVRFKLALLHAKPEVEVVIVGSSRLNDGISPALLGLGPAFNAATPSTSLPTLEYVAGQLGPRKLVLVELSEPQLRDTPFDGALTASEPLEGDLLGAWLHAHSALFPVRRAFAFENLPRVVALLAPGRFDGSEWFRSKWLIAALQGDAPLDGVQAAWAPRAGLDGPSSTSSDRPGSGSDRTAEGFLRAVELIRRSGAKVVLVGPPLASRRRAEECSAEQLAFRAELARRLAAPLLDFTCTPLDDRWFFDGEHLTAPGRRQFSQAVGKAVRALP